MKKTKYMYYFRDSVMKEESLSIGSLADNLNNSLREIDSDLRVDIKYPYVVVIGGIPSDDILSKNYLEYVKFEEVEFEYEEKVVKLKQGPVKGQLNWKSSNRGPVRLHPSTKTKEPGPIRKYESVKENGFTRLNKPKNTPPKGEIVGIFTGV